MSAPDPEAAPDGAGRHLRADSPFDQSSGETAMSGGIPVLGEVPWLGETTVMDPATTAWTPAVAPSAVAPPAVAPPAAEPASGLIAPTAPGNPQPVLVSCPECGASAMVEVTRRDARDFCAHCDYPLFWVRNQVLANDPFETGGAASRRLPGTVGRAASAAVGCPHCTEPNLPAATTCVRCGLSMQPVVVAPPVLLPPPPPAPEPEPVYVEDEPDRWWIWVLAAIATAILAFLIVWSVRTWA